MKKKKITHARFPTNFLNPWVATVLLNGLFNLKEEEKNPLSFHISLCRCHALPQNQYFCFAYHHQQLHFIQQASPLVN
jgi:hypothetical protein